MDIDGVDAEILFPPQRTMSHFLGDDDDDFVLAGVEAYNNFLFEEFCAPDPKRLIGLAQIPSLGIDNAVDSLRKAKARGAKGVLISNWPSGRGSLSPDDDPFWAAAVDEGIPVSVHINIISRAQRSSSRKAAAAKGNQLYDMRSEATRAKAIGGMSHVFAMATGAITDMIFTGVFEQFPELQVCWIETGVGWLPHFIECLDDRYWRNRAWGDLPIEQPPSYYWYRNNAASFITDRSGVELRHRVGVENMMWSSDYPHHGNDWPYSRKSIADAMGNIPAEERAKIVGGNATRIWHLDD
jgi:predicted TIM-barrel fold metal-dependent hydrolase